MTRVTNGSEKLHALRERMMTPLTPAQCYFVLHSAQRISEGYRDEILCECSAPQKLDRVL